MIISIAMLGIMLYMGIIISGIIVTIVLIVLLLLLLVLSLLCEPAGLGRARPGATTSSAARCT